MRNFTAALAIALALLPAVANAQWSGQIGGGATFPQAAQTRVALGLGTMAMQGAGAVAITGGNIAGISTIWNNTSRYGGQSLAVTNVVGGPAPVLSLGLTVTGIWPSGVQPYNQMYVNDSSDHRLAGDLAPVLSLGTSSGGAGSYGFSEALSLNCGTIGVVGAAGVNFATCFEARAAPSHNVGGTSIASPLGYNNTQNNYAILNPGATFWVLNSNGEDDIGNSYGSSSLIQVNREFARIGTDWGNVAIGASAGQIHGRMDLWFSSGRPTYDGTSIGSATASAGQNLPPFKTHIMMGGDSQEWQGDSTTTFSETFPQVYANGNSCSVGVNNCPATTAAAIMRPQILGTGLAWGNIHFATDALRFPNFEVKGTGETDIGSMRLVPSNSGGTIDVAGSYITGVAYSAEDQAIHQVGEYCYGTGGQGTVPGAIISIAAATAGVPISFGIVDAGWSPNTAATNNAAGPQTFQCGGRVVVTLTWTDVSDGTNAVLALAPSKGRVTIGSGGNLATFDSGGLVVASGLNAGNGGVVATNGFYLKNTGSNGGYGNIGPSGSSMIFKNYAGAIAGSYDMNAAVPAFSFNNWVKLPNYTVATLPPCNAGMQFAVATVGDATAPAYNSALTGGGAGVIPVFCNGTIWTAH